MAEARRVESRGLRAPDDLQRSTNEGQEGCARRLCGRVLRDASVVQERKRQSVETLRCRDERIQGGTRGFGRARLQTFGEFTQSAVPEAAGRSIPSGQHRQGMGSGLGDGLGIGERQIGEVGEAGCCVLLRVAQVGEKGEPVAKRMALGERPEAFGAAGKKGRDIGRQDAAIGIACRRRINRDGGRDRLRIHASS